MTASELATYALALTFAWAAAAKIAGFNRWSASLAGYGFTGAVSRATAFAVPIAEIGVVALLIAGRREVAAAATLALLALFSMAILRASRVRGSRLPCGCFGGDKERDFRWLLVRNAALAGLAAVILVGQRFGPTLLDGPVDAIPLALTVAGAAVVGWTLWQVLSSLKGSDRS